MSPELHPESDHRFQTRSFSDLLAVRVLTVALFFILTCLPYAHDPQGVDFYPLWTGSAAVLRGENPYSESVRRTLQEEWHVARQGADVAAVVAYPYPLLMLTAPLGVFSLEAALVVWECLMFASLWCICSVFRARGNSFYVPLCFYPLFHLVSLKNNSVLWIGLLFLLIECGWHRIQRWSALLPAVLIAKPQIGMLPALIALAGISHRSRAWGIAAVLLIVTFWGGSLLIFSEWPAEWLRAVTIYQNEAALASGFPESLLLLVAAGLVTAPALAGLFSLSVFPLNDLYCVVVVLAGWLSMPWRKALPGVAFSWLGFLLLKEANSMQAMIVFSIVPFAVVASVIQLKKRRRAKLP